MEARSKGGYVNPRRYVQADPSGILIFRFRPLPFTANASSVTSLMNVTSFHLKTESTLAPVGP
jgi:hypothetical protein